MWENKYKILDVDECIIADNLSLTNALIFVEGYMNKYYDEPNIRITIARNNEGLVKLDETVEYRPCDYELS